MAENLGGSRSRYGVGRVSSIVKLPRQSSFNNFFTFYELKPPPGNRLVLVRDFQARIEETPDRKTSFHYTEWGALKGLRETGDGERWTVRDPFSEVPPNRSFVYKSEKSEEGRLYQQVVHLRTAEEARFDKEQVHYSNASLRFYSGADTYTKLPDFEAGDYEPVEQFDWPLKTPDNILEQEKLSIRSQALGVRRSALEAAEKLGQKDGTRRDFSAEKNTVTVVPSFLRKLEPGELRGEARYEPGSGDPLTLRAADGSHESYGIVTDKEADTVSYFTAGYLVVENSNSGTLSLLKRRPLG